MGEGRGNAGAVWSLRIPSDAVVLNGPLFDGIVQQETIAAAHHLDAVGDEAAGLVLACVDFPILLRAAESEQHFGDGAVAFAAQAGVERAQGQDMPLPELYG